MALTLGGGRPRGGSPVPLRRTRMGPQQDLCGSGSALEYLDAKDQRVHAAAPHAK